MDLAKLSFEEFWARLEDLTANQLVEAMASDYGVQVDKCPRKKDTFRAAHAALQQGAAQAAQNPPTPPAEVAPEAGQAEPLQPPAPASGRRFQVRSRQSQGRWRAGRHWKSPFVIVAESDLRPSEWDELRNDKMIEVRDYDG